MIICRTGSILHIHCKYKTFYSIRREIFIFSEKHTKQIRVILFVDKIQRFYYYNGWHILQLLCSQKFNNIFASCTRHIRNGSCNVILSYVQNSASWLHLITCNPPVVTVRLFTLVHTIQNVSTRTKQGCTNFPRSRSHLKFLYPWGVT
jgi:hypothetical protein